MAAGWKSVISFPPKSLITAAKSDYIWTSSLEREKAGQVIYTRLSQSLKRNENRGILLIIMSLIII